MGFVANRSPYNVQEMLRIESISKIWFTKVSLYTWPLNFHKVAC